MHLVSATVLVTMWRFQRHLFWLIERNLLRNHMPVEHIKLKTNNWHNEHVPCNVSRHTEHQFPLIHIIWCIILYAILYPNMCASTHHSETPFPSLSEKRTLLFYTWCNYRKHGSLFIGLCSQNGLATHSLLRTKLQPKWNEYLEIRIGQTNTGTLSGGAN